MIKEIEGLPEGWEAVAFRVPKIGESFMSIDGDLVTNNIGQSSSRLIVQRCKMRRIVLEETGEVNRGGCYTGPYNPQRFMNGSLVFQDQPKIWRMVVEQRDKTIKEE